MKTIKLYGHLGKQFGKIHRYYVDTPYEAIRLLSANYKGFEEALLSFKGAGYRVILGKEDTALEDLCNPTGKDVIKIVPVISGQGGNGLGMIVLGAALMIAAPYAAAAVMNAAGGAAAMSTAGAMAVEMGMNAMVSFGMSMILGGIAELLYSPPPPPATHAVSGSFDGAVNTTRQGVPIALGYGELIVGSAVISAGLSTVSVPV